MLTLGKKMMMAALMRMLMMMRMAMMLISLLTMMAVVMLRIMMAILMRMMVRLSEAETQHSVFLNQKQKQERVFNSDTGSSHNECISISLSEEVSSLSRNSTVSCGSYPYTVALQTRLKVMNKTFSLYPRHFGCW